MRGERSKQLISEISAAIGRGSFGAAKKLLSELQTLNEWWLVKATSEAEGVRLETLIAFLEGDD
jgi:hypothetical protein